MKCKQKSILSILSVLLLIAVFAGSALALSGDGTNIKHTGGGSSVSGAYLVPSSGADHHVGFRFTWLTKDTSGNYTRKAALDVFYKGYNPNSSWGYHIKATVSGTTYRNLSKYEYKRWFDTVTIDREYYTDTNYKYCNRTDIPVTLPADEAAMTTWGKVDSNINTILNKMVSGATVANMKAADFVFIEPIYRVKIEGTNYCITVTEMGLIGCVVCSNSSTGNEGSGYGSGWVTIRRYTNYNWPDALKTTATHAGISAGTALSSSSYATFENMVKKGFGLMVVWNTSPHVLTVYYQTGTGASSLKIGSSYKLASDYTSYSSSYIRNSSNNYFTQTVNYDNNLTLMNGNSSGFNLTRDYYAFSKWQLSGTSTYFNGGASAKASALNASVATANQSATLVAVWSPISYTITYNLNGGKIGSSTTNPTQTYNYETDVYIGNYTSGATAYTVPTKSGYNFGGWKYTGSTVGYWTSGTTYANGYNKGEYEHGNVTLTAQWTPVTYTVTYNANGGSGAPSSQSKTHGVNLTLSSTKPTRTGYTFNGWNTKADGTGTNYSSGGTYTGNANLTLYAKWTANQLTVAYDCYQSSATISDTSKGFVLGAYNRLTTTSSSIAHKTIGGTDNVYYQTFTYNNELGGSGLHDFATFGLSAPTGYRFTYWKCGDNGELFDQSTTTYKPSDFTDEILTSDGLVWLTAQFTPNTYSVKFNGNGSTSGSMSNESFTYGTAKALTKNAFSRAFTVTYNYNGNGSSNTTANAAATFNGWATSTSGSKVYNDQQSVSNLSSTNGATVNLYAKWTDGSVTLPTPTRTGYTFTGWYTAATDGTKIGNGGASYTPSANITLYAHWRPNELTIAYDCYGSAVSITDTTKGFKLGTYNRLCSTTQTNKTIAGTNNVYYQLFLYDNALGGTGLHNFSTFGLSAPTGYKFSCWKNGSNTFDESTTTYKPSDFTDAIFTGDTYIWLTAQFTPNTYSVKYNGNGSSAGSMSNETFTYGTAKALTANAFSRTFTVTYNYNGNGSSNTTANAAATFNGWATSASGSKVYNDRQSVSNLSSTDGAVVNLYAKWTDGIVTLPSPTRTGYTFNGWYTTASGGTKIGNGGASYTVSANVTLYAQWTPIAYTIRFDKNGAGSGSMANLAMTYDIAKNLTKSTFVRSGYTFSGWNTRSDGTGTAYSDEQSVKNLTTVSGTVITLYAQWTPDSYTIRFNGNGATAGTMADMSMTSGVGKYLPENAYTKTGYAFTSWNTKDNGSGVAYANRAYVTDIATMGDTVVLYAQWSPIRYTVRYNGNGATSGTMQDQGFVYDTAQNLIANAFKREFTVTYDNNYSGASTSTAKAAATFNGWASTAGGAIAYTDRQNVKNLSAENGAIVNVYAKWTDKSVTLPTPKRTGYVFDGWYLSQTVGTKVGNGGTSYTPNANVTLYAHWTPISYTIRFKGNGSTSGSMADMAMTYDVIKSLTANAYKRTGYVFKGWNTQANGSGTGYADKQTVKNLTETNNVTITLYVQWTPITYTVRFNGNGADTGTMPDMTLTFDVEKPLTANTFVKNGMVFLGWNTKQDGSGTDYTDKQIVKNLTETQGTVITLYAQWQSQRQLSLEAVTPNAGYRETTDVITAFNLVNSGPGECLPSDNVSVVFKVYKGNSVIKTVTQNQVVVPGNERNLFYFKWNVPSGITASKLYISAEIVENGKSYGLIKNEYATCKYNVCATPDTQYEASGPDGFTVPSMPTVKTDTAKWSVWVFNNNSFSKISYGLSISNDTAMITPDASANAEQQNGAWVMKSGYGYRLSLKNNVNTLSGYSAASSEAYTKAQYALVLFPEFSYAGTENNCRTAELVSGKWVFRQNSDYGRIHFTPLWFPDGPYTATVVQSDCWTPAGMITRTSNTNTLTIFGSAYDDWYIG